jgi:hypothetical protein
MLLAMKHDAPESQEIELPSEMLPFYSSLVQQTDAIALANAQPALIPLMHELAHCVAAEGHSNATRRSTEEWARGIALSAVLAAVIEGESGASPETLRNTFRAAMGDDLDAAARCTADVLMSAGLLDMGADWSVPS